MALSLDGGRKMKVYIGVPRGFCAGVVRAIDVVELALKRFEPPIFVKHQIVHNPYVVKSLEEKGAITVEDVNEIPEGSTVVSQPTALRPKTSRRLPPATSM
jgi:4-hydroxy-3-methylbut-2-enyl diphosphate reductase